MTMWGVLLRITSGKTYLQSNSWAVQSPMILFEDNSVILPATTKADVFQ